MRARGPISCWWLPMLICSSHGLLFPETMMWQKKLDPVDVQKDPESKKDAKRGNLLCSFKTK
jgi:hypothetical protein